MRMKFKIFYPKDHQDESKRGVEYKPPPKHMVVMNSDGVFFQYCGERYYPCIKNNKYKFIKHNKTCFNFIPYYFYNDIT